MKIAVIKTGGKQYKVKEKDKLKIEKIKGEVGQTIDFDNVLLVAEDKKVEIGNPFIKNRKVTAKILLQDRAKKVIVIKYKAKTRYRVKRGHRQAYTEIEIEKI